MLASGFSAGSVAQSPGAALRDVDPSAIRELAVLFNSLRNAYPQHRRSGGPRKFPSCNNLPRTFPLHLPCTNTEVEP